MRTLLTYLPFLAFGAAEAQSTRITEFRTDMAGGPSQGVAMGGKLYFSAYDLDHGRELWVTDGTAEGTYRLKDINPGLGSGIAEYFEWSSFPVGDLLYFRATDGSTGSELWRTDGTEAGTWLVKDIDPGFYGSGPGGFAEVDGMLFFTAYTGSQLWRSNGTEAGTQLVRSFSVATNLYGHQGTLYFSGDPDNTGQELWRSNGTFNTTERVKDLNGAIGASLPINFHGAGSLVYFDAATDAGWELWRSDGTEEGTWMVKDINPGGANGTLYGYADKLMAHLGDTLYFRADDGVNGGQLWRTNGTEASTVRVSEIPAFITTYCRLPLVEGKVLVNNLEEGHWWAYDPATDQTTETGYPSHAWFGWQTGKYAFIGGDMIYAGKDSVFGCEIWTASGTLGDERRSQETHFTDNWNTLSEQGFNTIIGTVNGQVLFTQARSILDFQVPLYALDPVAPPCRKPQQGVAVPMGGSSLHVIFDREAEYGLHEVQYRASGLDPWQSLQTGTGHAELPVDPALPWEYQVRRDCNGTWSEWGPLFSFDPAAPMFDGYYGPVIIADRCEDATTMRIYWTKGTGATAMQLRYRPEADASAPWNMASDSSGMRRITGLQPETLYRYEYRFHDGLYWMPWSYSPLFFATRTPEFPTGVQALAAGAWSVWPNPAEDLLHLGGPIGGPLAGRILDATGRTVWTGQIMGRTLPVHFLRPGSYILGIGGTYLRFVKG